MVHWHVELDDPHGHHFRVSLKLLRPDAQQAFSLPVWIQGSYLVREFSRHLGPLQARQGGQLRAVLQTGKNSWQIDCQGRAALTLSYRVYAFDASVRGAFLDARRGFFNGSSLFLQVHGRREQAHRLTLGRLPAGWQVATAMPPASTGRGYECADYDELLDHPVALGPFWRGRFEAGGAPHELVISGAWPQVDSERLLADTRRICATQQAFWPDAPAPFARYSFLLHCAENGAGGLEHRASCALLAPRSELPVLGQCASSDGYVNLLSLISHEYFHAWNVKRLKPAELARPDHGCENPTRLLWFFEGFTSYYDELMLRRCGLIDAPAYLRLLARSISAVAATPGRLRHSLEAASFEAWTKFYRPDENTANATVSYYSKGALVALALDLSLRRRGHSLDQLMAWLWRHCGAAQPGGGALVLDDLALGLRALAGLRAGAALHQQLLAWVQGTDELPLAELLASVGLELQAEAATLAASLGLRLSEGPVRGVQVRAVLAGGPAQRAGVSAGDELLALDGWRIHRLDEAQAWLRPGQPFELLLVRDQRVQRLLLHPGPASVPGSSPGNLHLSLQDSASPTVRARRQAWLDG